MSGFLLRLLVSALGLWLAGRLVPGVSIAGWPTLLAAAFLLGFVNAVVRPLVVLLTLPLTLLTLGLFLLVINAAMLGLVSVLLEGFRITGFGSALLGSLVVSLTSWLGNAWVGASGRFEVLIVRRDDG